MVMHIQGKENSLRNWKIEKEKRKRKEGEKKEKRERE